MCYALDRDVDGSEDGQVDREANQLNITTAIPDSGESPAAVTPQKRPAIEVLESATRKAARIEHDDGVSIAEASTARTLPIGLDAKEDTEIELLKKKLKQALEENKSLRKKNKDLEEDAEQYEEDCHELRAKIVLAEQNMKNMKERLSTAENESIITSKETSKRLEIKGRASYDKRLQTQMTNFKESLKSAREKNAKALSDEKAVQIEKDQEHKEAIIELKDQHKNAIAALREEQKNVLAEAKAAHKAEMSETKTELADLKNRKGQTHESVQLAKEVEKLKREKETLEAHCREAIENSKVTRAGVAKMESKMREWKSKVDHAVKQQKETKKTMEDMKAEYEGHLDQETQRWEIQFRKASTLEQQNTEVRRTNFAFRTQIEIRERKVAQLESDLKAANNVITQLSNATHYQDDEVKGEADPLSHLTTGITVIDAGTMSNLEGTNNLEPMGNDQNGGSVRSHQSLQSFHSSGSHHIFRAPQEMLPVAKGQVTCETNEGMADEITVETLDSMWTDLVHDSPGGSEVEVLTANPLA